MIGKIDKTRLQSYDPPQSTVIRPFALLYSHTARLKLNPEKREGRPRFITRARARRLAVFLCVSVGVVCFAIQITSGAQRYKLRTLHRYSLATLAGFKAAFKGERETLSSAERTLQGIPSAKDGHPLAAATDHAASAPSRTQLARPYPAHPAAPAALAVAAAQPPLAA